MRMVWLPGYVIAPALRSFAVPALALLALWLLENVAGAVSGALTSAGGVAYWAHLGGFAFGLIIAEATGLLREGRADYLLADARHAIIASGGTSAEAIQSFREYLKLNPSDWRTRLELAVAVRGAGTPAARSESDGIVLEILRARLGDGTSALAVYAEARRLDLEPVLTARERLRLAGVAQDAGQADIARDLLSAIVTETPDAPEGEMARLKLGQLLLRWDPREAQAVLTDLVARYPASDWRDRAEYLLAEAAALLQRQSNS
jgi:tetratricopeptide (TPR) repeat protein